MNVLAAVFMSECGDRMGGNGEICIKNVGDSRIPTVFLVLVHASAFGAAGIMFGVVVGFAFLAKDHVSTISDKGAAFAKGDGVLERQISAVLLDGGQDGFPPNVKGRGEGIRLDMPGFLL
jgi:hypothetical protein